MVNELNDIKKNYNQFKNVLKQFETETTDDHYKTMSKNVAEAIMTDDWSKVKLIGYVIIDNVKETNVNYILGTDNKGYARINKDIRTGQYGRYLQYFYRYKNRYYIKIPSLETQKEDIYYRIKNINEVISKMTKKLLVQIKECPTKLFNGDLYGTDDAKIVKNAIKLYGNELDEEPKYKILIYNNGYLKSKDGKIEFIEFRPALPVM